MNSKCSKTISGPNTDRNACIIIAAPMRSRVSLVKQADNAHATATINARRDQLVHPVKMVRTELQVNLVNLDNRVCLATIRQSTTTSRDAVVHARTAHPAHRELQVHQEIPEQPEIQVHRDHLVNQADPEHPASQAAAVQVNQADQEAPVQLDNRELEADAVNPDRKDQAVDQDRRDCQVPLDIQAVTARWVVQAKQDRLAHQANAVHQAHQVKQVATQHRVAMPATARAHVVKCSQNTREHAIIDSSDVEMIRQHSIMLKMLLVVVGLYRFERNKL